MLCALSSALPSLSVQLGCPLQQGACIFHPGAPRTAPRAEPTQQDLCHKCGSQGFYSTHCTQNRNQSSTLNGTLRSDRGTKFLSYVEVRTLIAKGVWEPRLPGKRQKEHRKMQHFLPMYSSFLTQTRLVEIHGCTTSLMVAVLTRLLVRFAERKVELRPGNTSTWSCLPH